MSLCHRTGIPGQKTREGAIKGIPFNSRALLRSAIPSILAHSARHMDRCSTKRSESWEAGLLEVTVEAGHHLPVLSDHL